MLKIMFGLTARLRRLEARRMATDTPPPRIFVLYPGDEVPPECRENDCVIQVTYESPLDKEDTA